MNRMKHFLLIVTALCIAMLCSASKTMAQSNEQWYLVTDKGVEIAGTDGLFLQKHRTEARTFAILKLKTDGNVESLVKNVRKITFIKKQSTGIAKVENHAANVQLAFEEGTLTLTHLQPMETVSLFSSTGVKMADKQADAHGTAHIITANMPNGVYILKTLYTNITFIKK